MLDIGCGAGVPVTRALADRYRVLGVDLSAEQVKLARANVPRAEIAQADVMSIAIEPGSLDAAIGFYALFHLPRHEHAELFARLARWLRPGGLLLLTVARHSEAGYTEDHFFGETMYWSNWSSDEYRVLLGESGFEITASGIVGHGYELAPPERHPYLLAERRSA